jgi:hypothetical protein
MSISRSRYDTGIWTGRVGRGEEEEGGVEKVEEKDLTLLSQLINGHRLPPDYMSIRLEIYSNNRIPAGHWYKLVTMEKEHYIKTDKEIRKKQQKFVRSLLYSKVTRAKGKSKGVLVK